MLIIIIIPVPIKFRFDFPYRDLVKKKKKSITIKYDQMEFDSYLDNKLNLIYYLCCKFIGIFYVSQNFVYHLKVYKFLIDLKNNIFGSYGDNDQFNLSLRRELNSSN